MFLNWAEPEGQGEQVQWPTSDPDESPEELATAQTRRRFNMVNAPILTSTGTPYLYNDKDVDEIWKPPMPRIYLENPVFKFPKSMKRATLQLEKFLRWRRRLAFREEQAWSRLRMLVLLAENDTLPWGGDMVFKIFNDLDTVLFNGRLKGNVSLEWDTEDKMSGNDPGSIWGRATPDGASLTRHFALIRLNAKYLLLPPKNRTSVGEHGDLRDEVCGSFLVTLAVLLHEMVVSRATTLTHNGERVLRLRQHAYLHVTTGTMHFAKDAMEREDDDESHCRYYRRCLHAVDMRAKDLGIRAAAEYPEDHRLFDPESHPEYKTLCEKIAEVNRRLKFELRTLKEKIEKKGGEIMSMLGFE